MNTSIHSTIVVDCRQDYEFVGGHIKGAINIDNQAEIKRFFLGDILKLRQLMGSRTIIVFHCEFSQRRGPALWRALRDMDRKINAANYPKVFFPEMYVLEKGY